MSKLLYQGHASLRLTLNDGRVIYIDPYAGTGYEKEADFILVTHQHSDHNAIQKVIQKDNCVIISNKEALDNGEYKQFEFDGLKIEAVEAYNKRHSKDECVGYILDFDGLKMYISGDTSTTEQMKTLSKHNIDYALFCADGIFNMGLKESAECAELVGAKHNSPYHIAPPRLFSNRKAEKWTAPNKLIIEPNKEIEL